MRTLRAQIQWQDLGLLKELYILTGTEALQLFLSYACKAKKIKELFHLT